MALWVNDWEKIKGECMAEECPQEYKSVCASQCPILS